MHYLKSYAFVFSSRNWLTNMMFAILCTFIPAIGPIVLIGYFFEIFDTLLHPHRAEHDKEFDYPLDAIRAADQPSDAFTAQPLSVLPADPDHDGEPVAYPDFTFERFSEYLMRGIWPFLVRLIFNLPLSFLFAVIFMVGMVGVGISGQANAQVAGPLVFVVGLLVFFLGTILMGVLSTPLYLRAGLSRDFGSAFSMPFFRDFLHRVGKEVVLTELFLSGTSFILSLLGLMACYIGIFPAIAVIMFARIHLDLQLYKLYLERGGTPIEAKEKRSLDVRHRDEEDW